jgi:cyclophilin family peptidyl-prolyl cis-trans isomerase
MQRILIGSALLLILQAGGAAADSTSTAPPTSSPVSIEPKAASTEPKAAATAEPKAAVTETKPAAAKASPAGEQVVVLETVKGPVVIRLRDSDAPKTCANFRKLVQSKFYDGTYFHRVIPGFMIQGGDPNTKNADPNDDGIGGPGYTVPAEIKLQHVRGAVATARQSDAVNPKRESSGSQFFICLVPLPSLDRGGYTVFGEVISGMNAVDAIAALAKDPGILQGAAGPNPQKKALITRAYLAPLSKYEKATEAAAK